MRPPRSRVQSVFLFNSQDATNNWIPTKYDVGSWVTLNPGRGGEHARDARRHGAYKAQILEFKMNKAVVEEVRVRHAYQHHALHLRERDRPPKSLSNCKFGMEPYIHICTLDWWT